MYTEKRWEDLNHPTTLEDAASQLLDRAGNRVSSLNNIILAVLETTMNREEVHLDFDPSSATAGIQGALNCLARDLHEAASEMMHGRVPAMDTGFLDKNRMLFQRKGKEGLVPPIARGDSEEGSALPTV